MDQAERHYERAFKHVYRYLSRTIDLMICYRFGPSTLKQILLSFTTDLKSAVSNLVIESELTEEQMGDAFRDVQPKNQECFGHQSCRFQ